MCALPIFEEANKVLLSAVPSSVSKKQLKPSNAHALSERVRTISGSDSISLRCVRDHIRHISESSLDKSELNIPVTHSLPTSLCDQVAPLDRLTDGIISAADTENQVNVTSTDDSSKKADLSSDSKPSSNETKIGSDVSSPDDPIQAPCTSILVEKSESSSELTENCTAKATEETNTDSSDATSLTETKMEDNVRERIYNNQSEQPASKGTSASTSSDTSPSDGGNSSKNPDVSQSTSSPEPSSASTSSPSTYKTPSTPTTSTSPTSPSLQTPSESPSKKNEGDEKETEEMEVVVGTPDTSGPNKCREWTMATQWSVEENESWVGIHCTV